MTHSILHSDLNSFYASVEAMLNPELRGKAIAVCGSTEERHGIILAKSDLAKKAGVKTGMVNWEARQRCPGLILIPPQYDQYLKYSKLTQAIYDRYTDLIEPFGMDECWLDVTGSQSLFGTPLQMAESIRRTVREELGLAVSIGVSFCKVFAKLGSDMKKPDAITVITPENFHEKVWPLAADEMIYCGRATKEKLDRYGIHTIGQVAETDPGFLQSILGVNGLSLWRYANGTDQSRVMHKGFVSPMKSIGHGVTCTADLQNEEEVWRVMLELSQDVGHRLRIHKLSARGVRVAIRDNDLCSSQFQCKTQLPSEIAAAGFREFQRKYQWRSNVRAVTISATDLVPMEDPDQLSIFVDAKKMEGKNQIQNAVEVLRDRFGKRTITYASLMGDLKIPHDGRHQVKMPGLMYQ